MERPRTPKRACAILCPQFHRLWRHMLEIRGGFRVPRQQSDSADNRPDATSQNGAETPATKAASEAKKHWLDYATAFLTLAAAGGAITAAVFTGWQATAIAPTSTRRISASFITGRRTRTAALNGWFLR